MSDHGLGTLVKLLERIADALDVLASRIRGGPRFVDPIVGAPLCRCEMPRSTRIAGPLTFCNGCYGLFARRRAQGGWLVVAPRYNPKTVRIDPEKDLAAIAAAERSGVISAADAAEQRRLARGEA